MPLIRYRIGDLVERHRQPDQTTYTVHGRAADSFQRPDGGRITTQQVEECFAGLGGVAHYQLVEHYDERWMLRYLTDVVTPSAVELGELKRRLIAKLGITGGITLLESDVIMPEKSGKFRLGYPARWKRQDVPA